MYLKEIRLENIKTYKDVTVDFFEDGKPRLWTGFLGPNGMGKSILLDCIAISLVGEAAIRSALPYPRDWVRYGSKYGVIETKIDISDEKETPGKKELLLRHYVTGKEGADIKDRYLSGRGIHSDYSNEDNQLFEKIVGGYRNKGYLLCGYGPFRRLPRAGERDPISQKEESPIRSSRIRTLFEEGLPVSEIESWLVDLDYRSYKEGPEAKKMYDDALGFLQKILPNAKFKEINKERQIIFETADGLVQLNELSDGYRSVVAWSANLVQHMFEAHPTNKLEGSGVVIVDEIDVHLHPGAQRKIISHLRKLFPNVQFIFSSHSPFVAQSLSENEIFRLERDIETNQTIVKPIEISFEGWRADQILTSDAFGLETSRDETTEQELKEYEQLITNIELGKASKEEIEKADNLKKELFSKIPFSGETERIRELEKQVSGLQAALEKYKKNDSSQ